MVATRYTIRYEKQLRFLQSDQTTDAGGEHAMAEYDERQNLAAWKQIHPEVRSECKEPIWYTVVATSDPPPGCRFHTRCPHVMDLCRTEVPVAFQAGTATVRCHLHTSGPELAGEPMATLPLPVRR